MSDPSYLEEVIVFPVSFAQRRLWLIDRLDPGNPAYNIPAVVRFDGPFDISAFERAINRVVERHETLRTNILVLDDEPKQVIVPSRPIVVRAVDLDGSGIDDDGVRRLIDEETLRPFDLASGPLLRAVVYRLGADARIVQLTIHHIVSDGWSMAVLLDEVSTAYDAERRGAPETRPELAIQYGDFAEWQREWLRGEVLERHLGYWRTKLAPPPPVLELPTDRPRPAVQTFVGASVAFTIAPEAVRALALLARQENATLFMALLAVFKALLFRYTGQEDLAVGSPIANRGRRELEPLIGFFVNTLVLRTTLSSRTTLRELVRSVRETTLDAFAHQDLPFEHLVEALQPERSLSHTPLFQVLFALQNTPVRAATVADARVSPMAIEATTAKFDLSISLTETPAGLAGAAEYNVDLFDRATIERLVAHFRVMVSAAGEADTPIGRLPLLTAGDRDLIAGWNATAADLGDPQTVHECFDLAAERHPDLPALEFEGETWSYAELQQRVDRMAAYLRHRGVGPEVIVGIRLDRSLDLLVALLGVMKAGGAYLPLDPSYPDERLEAMAADAGAALIIDQFPVLDEPAACSPSQVTPDHAAYVIFTSGSTGRPKGAINTHRAVVNRLRWMQREYAFRPGDRFLQKTPISFDVSVWELFGPLISGATLIVARPDGHKDAAYLRDVIDQHAISIVHFVPSMLRAFLDPPPASRCPTLRHVICSGEALPPDLRDACASALNAEISNLYGPTEAAVDVTFWRCGPGEQGPTVPIGHPIANARIHVADDGFAEVPVGIAGELLIGGLPVGRGYVNRPDVTAARFIPDPFGDDGARLYRTGDRARRRADGAIEFLGRLDWQIKIRGFRVEPAEIEAHLVAQPEVSAAVVVAREERPGDVRLVAYLVPAAGARIDVGALRSALAVVLPGYMVPAAFVEIEKLPLLSNGKLNRAVLPTPQWGASERAATPPRTPSEEIILGIWRELLGATHLGIDDNFFTLGGHSLLATQVVSRIASAFGVELALRVVFERPTVRALAAYVDDGRRESDGVALPPIERVPRSGPLPLSFAQQRLWFLAQIEGTSAAYNMPAALRIEGPLDAEAIERTLRELVARHETLRSRFPLLSGGPVQIIDALPMLSLPIEDLRTLAPEMREDAVARAAAAEFDGPFDVINGPLVRARLLRLDEELQVLLLTSHHMVSDGWSTGLLIDEFVRLYDAFRHGRPSPLPPLAVQYADFAAWQRQWLTGETRERQLAYWTRQLAGAPSASGLLTDRPRPPVQTFRGDMCTFRLAPEVAAAVRRLSQQSGATTYITMLAAFLVLLSRWTRQTDLVVGSPNAGRTRNELESVVGFFLNMLVLRVDLAGDPTFSEVVDRVRLVTLDAAAHQDVPFEQIVDALDVERSMSRTPLFQIVFSGAMPQSTPIDLPGVRVVPLPPAKVAAKFDLAVGVGEFGGEITGGFEYNTDLFDRDTMARMAAQYVAVVGAAVAAPDSRIADLALLSETAQSEVAGFSEPAAAPADSPETLPALVRTRARERGRQSAVSDDHGSVTWEALDQRSSALAQRLRSLGVGPEVPVAICLPRSAASVVASLGVMKAGGAYVPLDLSYPIDRLRFMLNDSGAPVAIAHSASAVAALVEGTSVVVLPFEEHVDEEVVETPLVLDPDAPAYVIYTSGSTGQPKGVTVTHRGLMALVNWHLAAFAVTGADRVSQVASLAFDASVWETWPALAAGATVYVAGDATVRTPSAVVKWLIDRRTTVSFLPTPMAEQALGGDWTGTALRVLLTGGDYLHHPPRPGLPFTLVNNYGPTENAVVATSGVVDAVRDADRPPSIGRPIAGSRAYIVGDRMDLVPVGVPGEMLLGGQSLARGYHANPALTAERFVPDPFSGAPGARLYRTGDLARWRRDGTIEFLGRIDRQVKLRGFRIELGEIEATLATHPSIVQAAVTLRGTDRDRRLVAYVVPDDAVDPQVLRAFLRERLPEHMVPADVIALDHLPMTGSGKIAYAALPSPSPRAATPRRAPRNDMETLIAGIWQEVLELEGVDVEDNFFDVGGHSLKLVDVHARLERSLGRPLSIVDLFQHPTVAGLAAYLSSDRPIEDAVVSAAEERARRQRAARIG